MMVSKRVRLCISEYQLFKLPSSLLSPPTPAPQLPTFSPPQGCDWNLKTSALDESRKGVLFVEIPVLWLKPMKITEYNEIFGTLKAYNCPLYKTSERRGTLSTTGHSTNFVMYMVLQFLDMTADHWCRRGVAALCMLDD